MVLTGCVSPAVERGPTAPTPTAFAATPNPVDVGGASDRWKGTTLRATLPNDSSRDRIVQSLLQPFQQASGCDLEILPVDVDRLVTSVGSGSSYADLCLLDGRLAILMGQQGALGPVPATAHDGTGADLVAGTSIATPAFFDATVSAYRNDALELDDIPQDWTAWWNTSAFPGARTLMKGAEGTLEFALMADGVDPLDLYPLDLDRAIASLRRVSGSIVDRWWETGPQVIDWLAGGRAALGSAVASQVFASAQTGLPLSVVWNEGLIQDSSWAIPVGAAGADVAADFIQFALTVPAQVALATTAGLGPVSFAAVRQLDPVVAASVPSGIANISRMARVDWPWWAENATAANEAFNNWLLGNPVKTI